MSLYQVFINGELHDEFRNYSVAVLFAMDECERTGATVRVVQDGKTLALYM